MKKVIRLSTKRNRNELSVSPVAGDWDLVPVAVLLWLGSFWRVVSGSLYGEAFHVEATLAFYCVVLIPCWLIWTVLRPSERRLPNGPGADARDVRKDARVIELLSRRAARKTG